MTEPMIDATKRAGAGHVPERRQAPTPLHFRRVELKYIVPERRTAELVDRIAPFVDTDPFLIARGTTSYPVTSLYFDSFDLQSLFTKEAGWLSRRRIRLRTYHEFFQPGKTLFFEIKRRHDFLVSKDRLPLTLTDADIDLASRTTLRRLLMLARDGSQDSYEEALLLDAWYNLQPSTLVSYEREAYVGKADRDLRLTIDRKLKGVWKPLGLVGSPPYRRCGVHPTLPRLMAYGAHQARGPNPLSASEYVIVELKFTHAIPAWTHQIIMAMNLQRSAYSKYAFVARDLRPNLFETTEDDE